MAINYGLLDTTIPAQLGALPGNTLARFIQSRQQVEDQNLARGEAETRNALARMQLTRGQREMAEEDAYRAALAGVKGGDYAAAMPDLMKASPSRAMALKKSMAEEQKGGLETALKRAEVVSSIAGQFAANPTRQMGVWTLQQLQANGWPAEVIAEMSAKLNAAKDEEIPQKAAAFYGMTQEGIKAAVESMHPKPAQQSPLGRLMAERDAAAARGDAAAVAAYEDRIKIERTRPEPTPYFGFIPTSAGIVTTDARTGRMTLGGPSAPGPSAQAPAPAAAPGTAPAPAAPPGSPLLPPAADPDLQRRIAAAKASGAAEGEAGAQARADLPRATAQADELLRLTDELLRHPGLEQAVGKSSLLGVQKIPGTDARDFTIRLDQIKGKQFLEAFQSLKGAGAITEQEGKRATEAIARMDTAGSEEEFKRAVREFQNVVRGTLGRTRARAGEGAAPAGSDTMPPPAEHAGRVIRDSSTGVRYRSDGRSWVRVQ